MLPALIKLLPELESEKSVPKSTIAFNLIIPPMSSRIRALYVPDDASLQFSSRGPRTGIIAGVNIITVCGTAARTNSTMLDRVEGASTRPLGRLNRPRIAGGSHTWKVEQ